MKKKLLLLLAAIVSLLVLAGAYASNQVRATPAEAALTLAGDDLIPRPLGVVNHAITIRRLPREVWPWLAQMGAGRAGWYSYDFIDNGRRRSADRILPQYQNISAGAIFPAVPGAKDAFVVVDCEPSKSLVLAWRQPNGQYQTTWAFILAPQATGGTRLIVRGRVAPGYHPFGMPQWLAIRVGRVAHFVMERKQLLDIAHRAESAKRS